MKVILILKTFRILLILLVVGFVVIFIISIPSLNRNSRISACIGNLRMLDAAKAQAAMELSLAEGSIISTADVDRYVKGGTQHVKCPSNPKQSFNTSYSLEPIGSNPRCLNNPSSHRL